MTRRRVYLPLDGEALRVLASAGELPTGPWLGWAAASVEEEAEYAAWLAAARAARSEDSRGRGVVASCDVLPEQVRVDDGGPGASVRVHGPVPRRWVAAVHVEETAGCDPADFLWFDGTELDTVIEETRGTGS